MESDPATLTLWQYLRDKGIGAAVGCTNDTPAILYVYLKEAIPAQDQFPTWEEYQVVWKVTGQAEPA